MTFNAFINCFINIVPSEDSFGELLLILIKAAQTLPLRVHSPVLLPCLISRSNIIILRVLVFCKAL